MDRCWQLSASAPAQLLPAAAAAAAAAAPRLRAAPRARLTVRAHPNAPGGAEFLATVALWPTAVEGGARPRRGWWRRPVRAWFMPQRVALRIYWQAVRLLAKGVRYLPHPRDADPAAYETVAPPSPPPPPARPPARPAPHCDPGCCPPPAICPPTHSRGIARGGNV